MARGRISSKIPKERFTMYLPETTVKRIRLASVNMNTTYSKLVDDAVLAYLNKAVD